MREPSGHRQDDGVREVSARTTRSSKSAFGNRAGSLLPAVASVPSPASSRWRRARAKATARAVRPAPRSLRDAGRDREVRRRVPRRSPGASSEREKSEARGDDAFKNCSSEVSRAEFDCAMQAPTADAFEKCLEDARAAGRDRLRGARGAGFYRVCAARPVMRCLLPSTAGPSTCQRTSPPSRHAWSSSSRKQTSLVSSSIAERGDGADVLGAHRGRLREDLDGAARARAGPASRASCGRRARRACAASASCRRVPRRRLHRGRRPHRGADGRQAGSARGAIDRDDAEVVDRCRGLGR